MSETDDGEKFRSGMSPGAGSMLGYLASLPTAELLARVQESRGPSDPAEEADLRRKLEAEIAANDAEIIRLQLENAANYKRLRDPPA